MLFGTRLGLVPLLFGLGAIPSACNSDSVSQTVNPIIGGVEVAADELPSVGVIKTNAGTICTGSLIAPQAVLTAAHCVEPFSLGVLGADVPDDIVYKFSLTRDANTASDDEWLRTRGAVWHESYQLQKEGGWNDIALLYLDAPLDGRPLQPLADETTMGILAPGARMAVAGYGVTRLDDDNAGVLTRGASQLEELQDLELRVDPLAGQQGCRGDSGGPLFADESMAMQVGIASHIAVGGFSPDTGLPDVACEHGVYYTRVDPYAAWIAAHLEPPPPSDSSGGCSTGGGGAHLLVWLPAIVAFVAAGGSRRRNHLRLTGEWRY
jgi:secreted trypsin-like serine protease